jgi:hypothetical protein
MRTLVALTAAGLTLGASLALAAPASAHGDRDQLREKRQALLAEPTGTPILSDNMQHLASFPGQAAISGCFLQTAPLFVTSGVDSIRVWDVTDGANPTPRGVLPQPLFENEAMNCGERRTPEGTQRFALVGVDLFAATPTQPEHVNVGGGELRIVDVTDPDNPVIRSTAPGTTSTHTVACVDETDCRYAYSAGDSGSGTFSIFDLRDLDAPKEVDSDPSQEGVQPFRSPTAAHKWNFDKAGIGTHTGFDGSSMWDVSKPRKPKLLATTGAAGGAGEASGKDGYNDFIHHNSFRPNAKAFKPNRKPSLKNGNILLVTEEDYEQTDCTLAGSFQTWHVKRLDGRPGGIVPLDKVELSDLQEQQPDGIETPVGGFCSAHWFDFRPGGLVAIGYYGGGTQILDVRKPKRIRSYGYAYWGASEVWDAMWLPVYDAEGRQTGKKSNVVYSIDLARGLDVYSVDVPGDGRGAEPDPAVSPDRSASDRAAGAMLPVGLVAGALLLVLAVRRRATA